MDNNESGNIFLNKIFRNITIRKNIFRQLAIIDNNYRQMVFTIQQIKSYKYKEYIRSIYLKITDDDMLIGGEKHSIESTLKQMECLEQLEFSEQLTSSLPLPLYELLPIHSLTSLTFGSKFRNIFKDDELVKMVNLKKLKFNVVKYNFDLFETSEYDPEDYGYSRDKYRLESEELEKRRIGITEYLPFGLEYFKISSLGTELNILPKSLKVLKITSSYGNVCKTIFELPSLESLHIDRLLPDYGYDDNKTTLKLPNSLTNLSIETFNLETLLLVKHSNLKSLIIGNKKKKLISLEFHQLEENNIYSLPSTLKKLVICKEYKSYLPFLKSVLPYKEIPEVLLEPFGPEETIDLKGKLKLDEVEIEMNKRDYSKISGVTLHNLDGKTIYLNNYIALEKLDVQCKWEESITKHMFPMSLTSLKFCNLWNGSFEISSLPISLIHLELSDRYIGVELPDELENLTNLQTLKFGNQSIFDQYIAKYPSTLTHLEFGNSWNQQFLPGQLCSMKNLKFLKLGQSFKSNLNGSMLPSTLKELHMNIKDFYPLVELSTLPITVLVCCKYFNGIFIPNTTLPTEMGTLKRIEFLDDYTQQLYVGSLPPSIETIVFHKSYFKQFLENSLPSSLTSIHIKSLNCNFPKFDSKITLSSNFSRLICSKQNKQFINYIFNSTLLSDYLKII